MQLIHEENNKLLKPEFIIITILIGISLAVRLQTPVLAQHRITHHCDMERKFHDFRC